MTVIYANQVDGWWSPPPHQRELKVLLSPVLQNISSSLSLGTVLLPPGASGDAHIHEDSQETWFVISGRGKLKIGDEEIALIPDTVAVAPQGIEHQIFNDSDEPLKVIFMFSPAGPEEQYLTK
jgi:mannose-6-phosphate isomerase-like protein (cupin superfamily)